MVQNWAILKLPSLTLLETLVAVLDAFANEAKPLGLEVCESFTYLGGVMHESGLTDQEASRWNGLAAGVMDSLNKSF